MQTANKPSKKGFYAAIAGTVLAALCCATPLLIITRAAVSSSSFTPYLDYAFMPALILLIIIAGVSFRQNKKSLSKCVIENNQIQ